MPFEVIAAGISFLRCFLGSIWLRGSLSARRKPCSDTEKNPGWTVVQLKSGSLPRAA
jgi:hypothetical protein